MVTMFVCVRTYTGDIINSLCQFMCSWCSVRVSLYRTVLWLLEAVYLEIKLKKGHVASNELVY